MALITCPECKREISDTAKACPSCGYDFTASQKILCPRCGVEAIPVKKKNSVSAGGIIGAAIFLISLPVLFFNLLIGAALIILALVVGSVTRGEHIEMVCPKCRRRIN